MSLFYDPSMKIHKAHREEREPGSRYYPGHSPVPFMFFKVDAESSCGLPGACFELCMEGQPIARGRSDVSGAVYFPSLYPGTYTLTEVSAPDGYESKAHTYLVTVDKQGDVWVDGTPMQSFRVENSKSSGICGSFTVIKYDVCTGQRLSGAQFELFLSSKPAAGGMTDQNGQIVFSNLRPGLYTLVETKPPAGYMQGTETYSIEVRKDGKVMIDGYPRSSILIENEPVVHFLCFKVTDAQAQHPLSGASFTLLSEGVPAMEAVSDRFGRVLFENLPAGNYAIHEQVPPPGYSTDDKTYMVEVRPDGRVMIGGRPSEQFVIYNTRQNGFWIEKINKEHEPLMGAVFEVRQNNKTIQTVVTGPDGRAKIDLPVPGTYTVAETRPPAGYLADMVPHTVDVGEEGTLLIDGISKDLLTVANSRRTYDISFHVEDAQDSTPIKGALYYLYKDTTALVSALSDDKGMVSFRGICPGSYIIKEQAPPVGYEPEAKGFSAVMEDSGTVKIDGVLSGDFVIKSERSAGIQINKVNPDDEPLTGALFELGNRSGVIQTAMTGPDGRAAFDKPAAGFYTLLEVRPPRGYRPDQVRHTVVVEQNGVVIIDAEKTAVLTVQGLPLLYEISFVNIDAQAGTPLPGAEFELLSDQTVVTSATADAGGVVNFGGFPLGEYTIQEASPADGCQAAADRMNVSVTADGIVTINGKPRQDFVLKSIRIRMEPEHPQ